MRKAMMAAAGTLLFLGGMAFAQRPATNVNWQRHPNLRSAQDLLLQASHKIGAAQQANEWDMNGHAQRAKDLIVQASDEIAAAAGAANANAH
jgi:hypothetical protein